MSKEGSFQLLVERYHSARHCPVCGAVPQMWQFIEETGEAKKVVTCSTSEEDLGDPQLGFLAMGCPLYMPPSAFYRPTKREATDTWNHYAAALTTLRKKNAPMRFAFDPK